MTTLRGEHQVWLQIIEYDLKILERNIPKAEDKLINLIGELLNITNQLLEKVELVNITEDSLNLVKNCQSIYEIMLDYQLKQQLELSISPMFLNHCLNKIHQYLNIIKCLQSDKIWPQNIIEHHNFWLYQIYANLNMFLTKLDPLASFYHDKFHIILVQLSQLYIQSQEFIGFYRIYPHFPLDTFNKQVHIIIKKLITLLKKIKSNFSDKLSVGEINTNLLDCLIIESLYYLSKFDKSPNSK